MTGTLAPVDYQVLYGLTVTSTFPLHQDRPAVASTAPDVTIVDAPQVPMSTETPAGHVLLDFGERPDRWYTVVRRADSTYLLRVYSICDMEISADLGHVAVRLVEGVDPGMRSIMVTGTLFALLLYLRGELVLHASAVEVGESIIGFMGHSGMGKSTLATLMCADGARLVTDDVLPIEPGATPRVRLGATELRLRPGAEVLATQFSPESVRHRISADDRHVLTVGAALSESPVLAALVIPRPNHDDRLEMEVLEPKPALFSILRFPRLMGWRDPSVQTRIFQQASALAATLPVIVAHIPWGPPFRPDIAARIHEASTRSCLGVPEAI